MLNEANNLAEYNFSCLFFKFNFTEHRQGGVCWQLSQN